MDLKLEACWMGECEILGTEVVRNLQNQRPWRDLMMSSQDDGLPGQLG